MRWIELATDADADPKIEKILREFGHAGFGVLIRIWMITGRKGARPGMAVDTDGAPFSVEYFAKRINTSTSYLRRLLDAAARVGHINAALWRDRGIVLFPALVKRSRRFQAVKDGAERSAAHRKRRFDRIAERDGACCCRCGSLDTLELERKIAKADGGTEDENNFQIACRFCARARRATIAPLRSAFRPASTPSRPATHDPQNSGVKTTILISESGGSTGDRRRSPGSTTAVRQPAFENSGANPAERTRTERQDVTGSDVRYCDLSKSTDRSSTHTGIAALARGFSPASDGPTTAEPQPLPLLGSAKPVNGHHGGHVFCRRKCVPGFLHAEFIESLGAGDYADRDRQVRRFYDLAIDRLPAGKAIADPPVKFWRREFAIHFALVEGLTDATTRVTGARPQDPHKRSTPCTGGEEERARIRAMVRRARASTG